MTLPALDAIFATLKSIVDDEIVDIIVIFTPVSTLTLSSSATSSHFFVHVYFQCSIHAMNSKYIYIIIISEETSIFAPQRIPFCMALGVAACTVGKVRARTVFMCVCSTFRSSDFLLFVKNGFVVGVRCQGNREPPADGATTPLSQRHSWLGSP